MLSGSALGAAAGTALKALQLYYWKPAGCCGVGADVAAGLQDMQTPELKVAIKSAQRSAERMVAGGGAAGPSPPATPAKHGA